MYQLSQIYGSFNMNVLFCYLVTIFLISFLLGFVSLQFAVSDRV